MIADILRGHQAGELSYGVSSGGFTVMVAFAGAGGLPAVRSTPILRSGHAYLAGGLVAPAVGSGRAEGANKS